ncbi:MAG: transglutaminase domain-containing protein [bacterium]|nr:transglutaminase domain-containing protein [bacterium]
MNRNQFEVTPEIQAKVDEVLAAARATNADDARKAEVLVHWVAQNIRYSGQTMGQGEGFTLHPGNMIFEQRSGVCKDIAGMLITMMRAAGLDSYAAMTMAGSRIDQVPADQFNHCVTACAWRRRRLPHVRPHLGAVQQRHLVEVRDRAALPGRLSRGADAQPHPLLAAGGVGAGGAAQRRAGRRRRPERHHRRVGRRRLRRPAAALRLRLAAPGTGDGRGRPAGRRQPARGRRDGHAPRARRLQRRHVAEDYLPHPPLRRDHRRHRPRLHQPAPAVDAQQRHILPRRQPGLAEGTRDLADAHVHAAARRAGNRAPAPGLEAGRRPRGRPRRRDLRHVRRQRRAGRARVHGHGEVGRQAPPDTT